VDDVAIQAATATGPMIRAMVLFYRLTRKVSGKSVTETFSSATALRKAQQEVEEFHRFRQLSNDWLPKLAVR
jgi:hypothetical protein